MKTVRIGAAQGFYGDTIDGAIANAMYGNIQYLAFDCLAELTMAILAKDKEKNPETGFTKDIIPAMQQLLHFVKEKKIKIMTNAGGLNPKAAQKAVLKTAEKMGITDLKVAVITGDDLLPDIEKLQQAGVSFQDLSTKKPFEKTVRDQLIFANAYIGAQPLAEALRQGADIVISGRTTDTAQFLAPLIYEFDWQEDEWDRLAGGIFMGHLLECSAQSTGGNFSGDWEAIEGMDRIGYPIAEVDENGDFIMTKAEECGGAVTVQTVKEQMLYEIHDPSAYLTPDVIMDITNVRLEEIGENKVKVTGVAGKPKPSDLKVVMGYEDGYLGQVMIGYAWPDAMKKAKAAEQIIHKQLQRKNMNYEEMRTDFVGHNSLHGPLAHEETGELNEVYLRMAVKSVDKRKADSFFRLFPPLALNGPPTMSFIGNLPTRQLIGMWSSLIPRELVENRISVTVKEAAAVEKSKA